MMFIRRHRALFAACRKPIVPAGRRRLPLPAFFDPLEPRCLLSAVPTVGITKTHDGSEINGSTTGAIVFAVTRAGGDLTQPLDINYTIDAASTAVGGSNYTVPTGTVTIAAHQTKATITIPVLDDGVADPAETLTLDVATSASYTVVPAKAAATAKIADAAPSVSIAKLHDGSEADGAGKGAAIFVVTRVGKDLSQPLTVAYSVDGASTATGGSDYVTPSGTVTIPAGQKSAQIAVTINADTVVDPNETIVLDLTAAPAYHLDPKATKDIATAKIKDVAAVDLLSALQFNTTGKTWHYTAHSGPLSGAGTAAVTNGTSGSFVYDNQLTASSGQSLEFILNTSPAMEGLVLNTFQEITPDANITVTLGGLIISPNILAGTATGTASASAMLGVVAVQGTATSTITLNGLKTLTVPEGGPYTAAQLTLKLTFNLTGTNAGHTVTASGTTTFTFWAVAGKGVVKTTIATHLAERTNQHSGSESISANEVLTSIT